MKCSPRPSTQQSTTAVFHIQPHGPFSPVFAALQLPQLFGFNPGVTLYWICDVLEGVENDAAESVIKFEALFCFL